jgi:hypothetical protein
METGLNRSPIPITQQTGKTLAFSDPVDFCMTPSSDI